MIAYLKLFRQFILRALLREKLRSAVTILGISLGVAVMIAIRLANTSATESFRAATESLAGDTSIRITGTAGRFDETVLRGLGWLREFGQVSPVIEGHAMAEAGPYSAENRDMLNVLGVDILRDRSLRRYRLIRFDEERGEPAAREFLLLLTDPGAIIITERFAARRGLSLGSPITLVIGDRRRDFSVRGLLRDEGPARAMDGNFALMDIAAAQLAFDRIGLLDRLDIRLKSEIPAEQAQSAITARLPPGLVVELPDESHNQVERMIAAFHFNLNALGSIALLVGLFLIYNTVSVSVITRRDEIGMLRAVGSSRGLTLSLFLGEALMLAAAGAVIGLPLGRLMAGAAVRATATTVETFYIASVATESAQRYSIGTAEVLIAFAIALPLSVIAALLPALEASRVQPVEAIRGAALLSRAIEPPKGYLIISAMLLVLGYAFTTFEPVAGLPVFGYVSALAFMFGGSFMVPAVLWGACRLTERLTRRVAVVKVEGKLAAANLTGAVGRISISVAALSVSLAMMVAISIMIGSFRETVSYWVNQTLSADIYARAATKRASSAETGMTPSAVELIKAQPEVEAVDPFTSAEIIFEGYPITVGAGDFSTFIEYGRLLFKSPGDAETRMRMAIARDVVVVSESFAMRFDKRPGNRIELPVASGTREFDIAAVYYDYSNNRGTVVMDLATYQNYYHSTGPSSLSIYLRAGADVEEARRRIAGVVGNRHEIVFTTNSTIRNEVMRIFDSTFAITYALEAIAIAVAALGVVSTLIALVLERRREFGVLSFLGATKRQIRKVVLTEAVVIGAVSQTVGMVIGTLISLVLVYVINVQSFGWTIQFRMPVGFLVQSTLVILVVSALAGLYPAGRAAGLNAVRFVREE